MKKPSHPVQLGIAFAFGMAVGAFLFGAFNGQFSNIEASAPGVGSVKVSTQAKSDYATVLRSLLADPTQEKEVLSWLESHAQVYKPTSDRLPDAVAATACEPFPEGVTPEAIEAKRRCAEKLSVRRFRELAQNHKPPFHYVGLLGEMGVPGETSPLHGRANVCRPGDLFGRRLQVANPESGASVEVLATGYYICTGALKTPDVQLSFDDARTLFPDRALAKVEQVLIVPLD